MPDLGRYAFEVLASYAVTLLLLGALVLLSWRAHRRAKAEMERAERGRDG